MADKTIKKMVMEVVNEKITTAQAEYTTGCTELDAKLVEDKKSLAMEKVNEILGK